jgi:hypothetical protein
VKEAACEITVAKDTNHDQQIVLKYEENKVINYATELEKEFKFETSDPANCPYDKIFLQFSPTQKQEGLFTEKTFTMIESEKGKKDFEFEIGTAGKKSKSAL